jgi:hypothetical protein
MGGTVRNITGETARKRTEDEARQAAAQQAADEKAKAAKLKATSTGVEEDRAARRRVRRGGRALLSEERLAPEAGVGQSTLGAGPMA